MIFTKPHQVDRCRFNRRIRRFCRNARLAVPSYDGLWSVSIVTTKGDCIASYRYPVLIDHGVLANGGAFAINVSGRVTANGAVKVTVSSSDKRATRYGRLTGNTGDGSWKRRAPKFVDSDPQRCDSGGFIKRCWITRLGGWSIRGTTPENSAESFPTARKSKQLACD